MSASPTLTSAGMSDLTPALRALSLSVHAAHHLAARRLLQDLANSVAQADNILDGLSAQALSDHAESYTRHVAYADPNGHFTIVYLVWRPGQFSPVHGHQTWCAYRVLKGELTEDHYRWNAASGRAAACGSVRRRRGDIVTAAAGLEHIHRLGNAGTDVAVSLHIYGVEQHAISTGVNLPVETDAGPAKPK
jgi:predicted metal-dependent enzyme (double-stranded beta helix superfamily)